MRRAVKSKSMVSEEIHLNDGLEAAGVAVVETDLGELIVQLAHDHPSHIIAPIIHKSREDIAELFKSAAGATDDDVSDVAHMTAFARTRLRSEFINADMGISGANFGVAETGSICLVTNEGNGRLTTTVPRVHVALMGIERIVPTIADLGTMLRVLARSATGQPLSVYSNILSGPRRTTDDETQSEPDGPDELHVVLVDNGRSELLGGELAEILYCIRCGACLNACPVYQSIGGHAYGSVYPGPVGAVLTPALQGLGAFGELPQASSLCGACREVCPVRIDIPRMLLALRRRSVQEIGAPAWIRYGMRAYAAAATRPALFRFAVRASRVRSWSPCAARMGDAFARSAQRLDVDPRFSSVRQAHVPGSMAIGSASAVSIDEAILRQLRARIARGAGTHAPHGHQAKLLPASHCAAPSEGGVNRPVSPFTTAWESLAVSFTTRTAPPTPFRSSRRSAAVLVPHRRCRGASRTWECLGSSMDCGVRYRERLRMAPRRSLRTRRTACGTRAHQGGCHRRVRRHRRERHCRARVGSRSSATGVAAAADPRDAAPRLTHARVAARFPGCRTHNR